MFDKDGRIDPTFGRLFGQIQEAKRHLQLVPITTLREFLEKTGAQTSGNMQVARMIVTQAVHAHEAAVRGCKK